MGKKSGGRVRVKQVGPKSAPVNPLDALSIPPEEMINLPPKPDSNIAHVWPLSTSEFSYCFYSFGFVSLLKFSIILKLSFLFLTKQILHFILFIIVMQARLSPWITNSLHRYILLTLIPQKL